MFSVVSSNLTAFPTIPTIISTALKPRSRTREVTRTRVEGVGREGRAVVGVVGVVRCWHCVRVHFKVGVEWLWGLWHGPLSSVVLECVLQILKEKQDLYSGYYDFSFCSVSNLQ